MPYGQSVRTGAVRRWTEAALRDVRIAARGLRRTPIFTLIVTASLVLGFALTACTLAAVNAYLVRSLPYPASDRLFHLRYAPPGPWEPRGMTAFDWKSVGDVVEFPVASSGDSVRLFEGGYPVSVRALRITHGFVEGLGVRVARGRRLEAADFVAGAEPVALIGYALWRDRFGSDPSIVGKPIRGEADSRPNAPETFRVVGVLTPGFYSGRDSSATVDLLVPQASPIRAYMVRLVEGVPKAAAERRLTEGVRQAATSPIPSDWPGVELESVRERYVGGLRPVLVGITIAVVLVIVIVSANVAVLMLLRSAQRRREVAIRLALGAASSDIARLLLVEAALVTVVALALGLGMTGASLSTLAPLIERQLGRPAPTPSGIVLDATVIAAAAVVGALIALAVSLTPMLSSGRRLLHALRHDGRVSSDGPAARRLRHGLIAFEVAGSLLLLVGCGLMIRSVVQMMSTDLGFDTNGLRASRVMVRARDYPDAAAFSRFHQRFADRVSSETRVPVAFSTWPPFYLPPGQRIEGEGGVQARAATIGVSAAYFDVFGIAMRQGRAFNPDEVAASEHVAIISETLAARLWPGGGALGKRVRAIEPTPEGMVTRPWRTVVGVAADVRQTYDDTDHGDFYAPRLPDTRFGTFYIRTDRSQQALFDSLRSAAAEIDRAAVINPPRTVADDDQRLAGTKFVTSLLMGFAGVAAFLAMLGIYGVTAYAVQQRQKELAIRVALGASRDAIIMMFLRDGALLLGAGTALGLAGAAGLSAILQQQVFGVQTFDLVTYAAASALILAAGVAAVWWPARRAADRHPATVLDAGT